jgi:vacuolar protein sorting-associated protein 18
MLVVYHTLKEGSDAAQAGSVFGLGRVQYTLPAPLVHVVASSETLVMGLATNNIIWIELGRSEQTIKLPRKTNEFTLYKLFLDPSARHLVVTSIQGENWYLYRGWQKPRQLKSFKMVIESIAWSKPALLGGAQSSTSTREMLVGARNGTIYEAILNAEEDFFRSQERYLQAVYSLPERHPITGIKFDFFPANDPKKALIIATTPSRIYQFIGTPERKSDDNGRLFNTIFARYRENTTPSKYYILCSTSTDIHDPFTAISEVPGSQPHSELHFFTPNGDQASSLPVGLAWLTGEEFMFVLYIVES